MRDSDGNKIVDLLPKEVSTSPNRINQNSSRAL